MEEDKPFHHCPNHPEVFFRCLLLVLVYDRSGGLICLTVVGFEHLLLEGFMSEDDFDNILEYSDMCDKHGSDAVDDYMEFHNTLDNFEEAYCGEWDSEEDFARHIVEECYNLEKMMGSLANYFDYERFARELFMYDYQMGANNNVFRRI